MTGTWRMILLDLIVGLGPFFVAGQLLWTDPEPWYVVPVVLATAAWAGLRYVDERGRYPELVDVLADRPFLLGGLTFAVVLSVVVGVVLVPVLGTVLVAVMVGMGLGHVGYRLVFGVLRPVPDHAVERWKGGGA